MYIHRPKFYTENSTFRPFISIQYQIHINGNSLRFSSDVTEFRRRLYLS